ncbi:MAG: hypothetical protein G01um101429_78 [Parcubacteria group bacterium Gr01-1014_29]|nr:MAG: hypothetical protein G01um101429_78 [Parcubacteria group bacterium Gr01-1014_29]
MGESFVHTCDRKVIKIIRQLAIPMGRVSLFVVFFWFGFLKLLGASPAGSLVNDLLGKTMPFWPFESFMVFLGILEMLVGIAFLIEGWERFAIALMAPHMIVTFLPFILLPEVVWYTFLTPTLEGQYIIKNLVVIALALSLGARLQPIGAPRRGR